VARPWLLCDGSPSGSEIEADEQAVPGRDRHRHPGRRWSHYPGTNPFPFTGGTIAKAIVDVSGEPFLDLENEVIAMMARE
jgi:hypothetical protein